MSDKQIISKDNLPKVLVTDWKDAARAAVPAGSCGDATGEYTEAMVAAVSWTGISLSCPSSAGTPLPPKPS